MTGAKPRTLGALIEAWLTMREAHGFVRGVGREWSSYRSQLSANKLMGKRPGSLKRRDIKALVMELMLGENKPSSQTVKHALRLIRGALEWAVEEEWVGANPAIGVKEPAKRAPEPWTFLDKGEMAALMSAPIPEKPRALFLLALFSGMRKGELLGLRWEDVHLDVAHSHVVVCSSHGGPTKNMRSREVPLLEPAVGALREYRSRYPALPRAHVFRRKSGGRHEEGYDGGWRHVWCSRILGRRVRFHDLRHSCASALISGDWAPEWVSRPLRMEEVQKWLGHCAISVTQRYAHLSADSLRSLVMKSSAPADGLGCLKTKMAGKPPSPAPTPYPWPTSMEG